MSRKKGCPQCGYTGTRSSSSCPGCQQRDLTVFVIILGVVSVIGALLALKITDNIANTTRAEKLNADVRKILQNPNENLDKFARVFSSSRATEKLWAQISKGSSTKRDEWLRFLRENSDRLLENVVATDQFCMFIRKGEQKMRAELSSGKYLSQVVDQCLKVLLAYQQHLSAKKTRDSIRDELERLRERKEETLDELEEKRESEEEISEDLVHVCAVIIGKMGKNLYEASIGDCQWGGYSKAVLFSTVDRVRSNHRHRITVLSEGRMQVKLKNGRTTTWPKYVELVNPDEIDEEIDDLEKEVTEIKEQIAKKEEALPGAKKAAKEARAKWKRQKQRLKSFVKRTE